MLKELVTKTNQKLITYYVGHGIKALPSERRHCLCGKEPGNGGALFTIIIDHQAFDLSVVDARVCTSHRHYVPDPVLLTLNST